MEAYEAVKGSYTVNAKTLSKAKKHMAVLHPLPRVDELAEDVDSDPRAAYFRQMTNGMYIRMVRDTTWRAFAIAPSFVTLRACRFRLAGFAGSVTAALKTKEVARAVSSLARVRVPQTFGRVRPSVAGVMKWTRSSRTLYSAHMSHPTLAQAFCSARSTKRGVYLLTESQSAKEEAALSSDPTPHCARSQGATPRSRDSTGFSGARARRSCFSRYT